MLKSQDLIIRDGLPHQGLFGFHFSPVTLGHHSERRLPPRPVQTKAVPQNLPVPSALLWPTHASAQMVLPQEPFPVTPLIPFLNSLFSLLWGTWNYFATCHVFCLCHMTSPFVPDRGSERLHWGQYLAHSCCSINICCWLTCWLSNSHKGVLTLRLGSGLYTWLYIVLKTLGS